MTTSSIRVDGPGGRLWRKARNWAEQPAFVKVWFVPLTLLLGLASAVIALCPFRKLAPWFGSSLGAVAWTPLVDGPAEARAALIGRAVRLAARYAPWRSDCFPQAMAAIALLRLYRIPYCLHFGVERRATDAGLDAHAWVSVGRLAITGGLASFGRFTVVGAFSRVS